MIAPPPHRPSRARRFRRVRSVLLSVLLLALSGPVDPAAGQDWAQDLLKKAKRARKLIQGKRPCGGRITVKREGWRTLGRGIEAQLLHVLPDGAEPRVELHLIRIDPRTVSVRVLLSRDFGREAATAEEFARRSGAWAVANAGYFGKDLSPLGLLVAQGRRRNPRVKRRGRQSDALYEGVFLVKAGRPEIRRSEGYRPGGEEAAVQAGPLLIAGGEAAPSPRDLRGLRDAVRLDGRTVLALDGGGRILIWVTASPLAGMNWCELRDLMLRYGEWERDAPAPGAGDRGIRWALNLDGGTSAQVYVRREGAKPLQVKGTAVPVVLGFFPRN